jgi:hypothetical protein
MTSVIGSPLFFVGLDSMHLLKAQSVTIFSGDSIALLWMGSNSHCKKRAAALMCSQGLMNSIKDPESSGFVTSL